MSLQNKADYVKNAKQTREHTCHWPGCTKQVKPAMWGCSQHWFKLPWAIRTKIWNSYKPGQEIRMNPTDKYLLAAKEAEDWIKTYIESQK